MKICLIGNDYKQQFPLVGYGGIESTVENLAAGLQDREDVKFCAIVPKRHVKADYKFPVIETNYTESSISGVPPVHFINEVRNIINSVDDKPDIIWSQSHWSALGLQDLGIPIICTNQDSGPWEDGKFIYRDNVYYRTVSKFLFDLVYKDALKKPFIDSVKSKSFWCHGGLMESEYQFYDNPEGYILWVAGLNWGWNAKGLDLFINLARRRPDKQFVAYGSGNDHIASELQNIGLPNFRFMGPLSRGQVHKDVFGNASLFFMQSQTQEAFGRTGLEAISKGTPVLGSTKGAIPELYKDFGICTDNFQEMVYALDIKFDRHDIFKRSEKYHIKNEIQFLIDKSKEIL